MPSLDCATSIIGVDEIIMCGRTRLQDFGASRSSTILRQLCLILFAVDDALFMNFLGVAARATICQGAASGCVEGFSVTFCPRARLIPVRDRSVHGYVV